MRVGHTIKKVRLALHMEQKEFAKELGLSPGSICLYEQDKRMPRLPVLRKILKLAIANDVPIQWDDFFEKDAQQ